MSVHWRKLITAPLVIIGVGIVVCMGSLILVQELITRPLLSLLIENQVLADTIRNCVSSVVLITSYYWFARWYEKRNPAELSTLFLGRELLIGVLIGFGSISASVFILYWLGHYQFLGISFANYNTKLFTLLLVAALIEELINRGLITRVLENWLGSYLAICAIALIEMLHLSNDNLRLDFFTVISLVGWAFTMAMLYIYTKRIWLPLFFHIGWNFAQPFYGTNLTGLSDMGTIIQSRMEGPEILTGGLVGIEGSIITFLLLILPGIVCLYLAVKQGKIVKGRLFEKNSNDQ